MEKVEMALWGTDFMIGGIGFVLGGTYGAVLCFLTGGILILYALLRRDRKAASVLVDAESQPYLLIPTRRWHTRGLAIFIVVFVIALIVGTLKYGEPFKKQTSAPITPLPATSDNDKNSIPSQPKITPVPVAPQPKRPKTVLLNPAPSPQTESHNSTTGAAGGNTGDVTLGPCSNFQNGGNGNQQSTNCTFQDPQRRLSETEKTKLAALSDTPLDLIVWANGSDKKAWNLGDDICKALRDRAGWKVAAADCVESMIPGGAPYNVDMVVFLNPVDMKRIDSRHSLIHLNGVSQLVEMLRSFGLSVEVSTSEKVARNVVKIVMG